jgi:hypothetical protein
MQCACGMRMRTLAVFIFLGSLVSLFARAQDDTALDAQLAGSGQPAALPGNAGYQRAWGRKWPAIANKTGALDAVRNDVALIATKVGPVVIVAFTQENADRRWTGDNEAQQTLGKLGRAIVDRWSPAGLDADGFGWSDPLRAGSSRP